MESISGDGWAQVKRLAGRGPGDFLGGVDSGVLAHRVGARGSPPPPALVEAAEPKGTKLFLWPRPWAAEISHSGCLCCAVREQK